MDKRKLYFREDGTFKLMQLTDLHYSEEAPQKDARTVALMRELIEAEKPDFIMITGDAVYGEKNIVNIDRVLAPIIEAGIDWSFTFGNHDCEPHGNKEELLAKICSMPNNFTWHDPASVDGHGNHWVELCGRDEKPQWLFVGVDSGHMNRMKQVGGYAYVTRRQIQWYQDMIASYEQAGETFSAMVFMHIALHEHAEVWKYEVCYGTKRDGVGHPRVNSGFFSAMLEAGHTKGVFVGHDHANDYWGWLYGIALGYGRTSGFDSYGTKDHFRGCRMFRFREGDTENFETWVRVEHGVVVDDPWIQHPIQSRDEG